MIIAVRTPPPPHPYNSWKDPAERIMSILNLALQAVGLMGELLKTDELEESIKESSAIKGIRNLANEKVKHEVIESMKATKSLLKELLEWLTLKEKQFKVNEAATEEEIDTLPYILNVHGRLLFSEKISSVDALIRWWTLLLRCVDAFY